MTTTKHQDADRRERATQGLPPDVHDPATESAYATLRRPSSDAKTKRRPTTRKDKPA